MVYLRGKCGFCNCGLILSDRTGRMELERYPDDLGDMEENQFPEKGSCVVRRCPHCGKKVYSFLSEEEAIIGYQDYKRGWHTGEVDE